MAARSVGSGGRRDLSRYLRPFLVLQVRQSTMNGSLASALAPHDDYDDEMVVAALRMLGQDPDGPLACVYCEAPADTWDHLYSLTLEKKFSGFGHVLGNLVPACKRCNSSKGKRPWEQVLAENRSDPSVREQARSRITQYRDAFLPAPMTEQELERLAPEDMAAFNRIRADLLALMAEADRVAARVRRAAQQAAPARQRLGGMSGAER